MQEGIKDHDAFLISSCAQADITVIWLDKPAEDISYHLHQEQKCSNQKYDAEPLWDGTLCQTALLEQALKKETF